MKTYFVNYLKYLHEQLVTEKVVTAMIENKTRTAPKINFCLVSSRDSVQRALSENSFSPLSRILNNFPINEAPYPYNRNDVAGFAGQKVKSYVERYDNILMQGQEIIFDDNTNNLIPLQAEKLNEVKDFVSDLILMACEEILDGAGEVRAKVIQILGLQPLLDAWHAKKDLQAQLRSQLISAYFTQVLLGAIVNIWNETKASAYHDAGRQPKAPANLTIFITNKLLGNGTNPIFLEKITSFPVYGRPLVQSCAMIFTTMPVEEVLKLMITDLRPLTSAQLALMPVHLQRDWLKAKFSFWLEAIKLTSEYLLQHLSIDRDDTKQNAEEDKRELTFAKNELTARLSGVVAEDHSYQLALSDYFAAKIGMREKIFGNAIHYLHYICSDTTRKLNDMLECLRQVSDKKLFTFFSKKSAFPKLSSEPIINPALVKWFNVRDNGTIIQSILRDIEDRKLGIVFRAYVSDKMADFVEQQGSYLRLTAAEEKVLLNIEQARFDYQYSISNPNYVLQAFVVQCPDGPLNDILNFYGEAIPKKPEEDVVNYYQQRSVI